MPEASTATEARPDLSALDRETRICIAVAEVLGYRWFDKTQPGACQHWVLKRHESEPYAGVLHGDDKKEWSSIPHRLPNWVRDPAAWGALLEKEFSGFETDSDGRKRVEWDTYNGAAFKSGPWAATLGEAVALGFLAKHGVPVLE